MTEKRVGVRTRNVGRAVRARTIQRRAERLLDYLRLESAELSILLCDDAFITGLNRDSRHRDTPTDVLSFSMNEGESLPGDSSLLGDVIISVETARRQAPAVGHTNTDEVTSLLIHGLLHLAGYDDRSQADARRMGKEVEGYVERLRRILESPSRA